MAEITKWKGKKIGITNNKLDINLTLSIPKIFKDLKNMIDDDEFHEYWGEICEDISKDYVNIKKETSDIEIREYGGNRTGFTMYLYDFNSFRYGYNYAVLWQYDEAMMSIAPMEVMSHINPIKWSKGKVLVAGLGMGFYLNQILNKKNVTEVHVVDNNQDVIDMYKERFEIHPKLTIHNENIFKFKSKVDFDFFYIDIWQTRDYKTFINQSEQMVELKRNGSVKFNKMSFWGIEECVWFRFLNYGWIGKGKESVSALINDLDMDWAEKDIKNLIYAIIFR